MDQRTDNGRHTDGDATSADCADGADGANGDGRESRGDREGTAAAAAPADRAPPLRLADYRPPAGVFDEMLDAEGRPRPHWRGLAESLEAMRPGELDRRFAQARRMIRENGVTYNAHGDPGGLDRPWEFDPFPVCFSTEEWARLEAALVQRATLLEIILEDLYGPQNLLAEKLIPAELIYAHPGFLRACHGLRPGGGRWLTLYSADLGRSPDGRVWVLAERTQSPSGAGYALENRIVLSRALPDVYRDCRVRRLAPFFRTLRETLINLAPKRRGDPRIVLLTPGPYNETYFEHAYLARYLGFTLVEGGDLTVRDNCVYLKLLGGLQPVDVILRRMDDDYCDPLELRPDSFLGVAGLTQAVRSGNVAVANPLGSGLAETPALSPFLPRLCRKLLGEDLRLPPVPAWWCGHPYGLSHVLANLHRLVIKSAVPLVGFRPVFGSKLSAAELADLEARIRARPRDFVAQEPLDLSTAPALDDTGPEPRRAGLRAFLAAAPDGGFAVMPGGLCRVSPGVEVPVISINRGGSGKDVWVLSDEPVPFVSLLPAPGGPVEISRGGDDLPSRVADNLFWLGRYIERVEGLLRLLRNILGRHMENSAGEHPPELRALMAALRRMVGGGVAAPASPRGLDADLADMLFDLRRPGTLAADLDALRRVTRTVRDRLSVDAWRILSGLKIESEVRSPKSEVEMPAPGAAASETSDLGLRTPDYGLADVPATLNGLLQGLSAFCGLMSESMTRGQGWRFMDMGRRLERAIHTAGLVRGTLVTASRDDGGDESRLLEALLEVADSIMTYRRRYRSGPAAAAVLDLLLADESNPRSLAFQLAALEQHVERLPADRSRPGRTPEQRIVLELLTDLRLAEADALARAGGGREGRDRTALDALLGRIEAELPALSDALTRHYLAHSDIPRQLPLGGSPAADDAATGPEAATAAAAAAAAAAQSPEARL
jgi:uncharacterized circularly permuted ATP-grasp superfamily protein/uncharacterized alpha-E superfamily protein